MKSESLFDFYLITTETHHTFTHDCTQFIFQKVKGVQGKTYLAHY